MEVEQLPGNNRNAGCTRLAASRLDIEHTLVCNLNEPVKKNNNIVREKTKRSFWTALHNHKSDREKHRNVIWKDLTLAADPGRL